jgi:hypothetical protein
MSSTFLARVFTIYNYLARVVFILKMEETRSFETSVRATSTRHHIPEDFILHSHGCESLKSCIVIFVYWSQMPWSCVALALGYHTFAVFIYHKQKATHNLRILPLTSSSFTLFTSSFQKKRNVFPRPSLILRRSFPVTGVGKHKILRRLCMSN